MRVGRLWLVALAFCFTCSSLDNITISRSGSTIIPEGSIVGELLGDVGFSNFNNFDLSQSEAFQNQGYSKDQIDSVRVQRVRLVVNAPPGANFDFLDSIAFYAEAEGFPRVRIAHLDDVPTGVTEIELEIDDVELVGYASAPAIQVTTEASGMAPADETTVTGTIDFDVDIDVAGALGC